MKIPSKTILGFLFLTAIQLAQTGCGGPGYGGGGVVYGDGPWIDNEVVVTGGGRGWFGRGDRGGGGYVHPSAAAHAAPRGDAGHAAGGESHPSGGGGDHHK